MRRQRLQQVVDGLPDEVDLDALLEKLYVLRKIEVAEEELAQGEGIPDDEAKRRLKAGSRIHG